MAKRTTTVFDTVDAYVTLLEAQDWPAHPTTGDVPLVVDGDTQDQFLEAVVVLGVLPGGSTEWKTVGAPSQDESFRLATRIGTRVPGASQREARARLKTIVAVVEAAVRDQTTGVPAGGFVAAVGGVQYMTWRGAVVAQETYALADGGFGAYADHELQFVARI